MFLIAPGAVWDLYELHTATSAVAEMLWTGEIGRTGEQPSLKH